MNNNLVTLAFRVPDETETLIVKLINLYNYKEGKSWTKSDMVRDSLKRGADEVGKKYGLKL